MKNERAKRFWAKVHKTPHCWEWVGGLTSQGYGMCPWRGVPGKPRQTAHRFSWELHNGPIPQGLCVLHRCDNPACVRPDHLFVGTMADNNADMHAKGRAVKGGTYSRAGYQRGERNRASRLTATKALALRRDRARGMFFRELATKYGISTSQAWRVAKAENWKHLTPKKG